MKIEYDAEKSKEISEKMYSKWARDRKPPRGEMLHSTDVVGCEVAPYNRLTGCEYYVTRKAIGFMVFGTVSGKILASLYPKEEREFTAVLEDLVEGHIDVFEKLKFPLEGKSSRKRIFRVNDLPQSWVEQIMNYMTMKNADVGWIVILNVFSIQICAFRIEMTGQDRLDWAIYLADKVNRIKDSAKNHDPSKLRINPEDYGNCRYKEHCSRRQECHSKWLELERKKALNMAKKKTNK